MSFGQFRMGVPEVWPLIVAPTFVEGPNYKLVFGHCSFLSGVGSSLFVYSKLNISTDSR